MLNKKFDHCKLEMKKYLVTLGKYLNSLPNIATTSLLITVGLPFMIFCLSRSTEGSPHAMRNFWFVLTLICIPSLVASTWGTLWHIGCLWEKQNPSPEQLLKDAQMRLEAEKILIQAEKLAQERRLLIEQHLQEQILGTENVLRKVEPEHKQHQVVLSQ